MKIKQKCCVPKCFIILGTRFEPNLKFLLFCINICHNTDVDVYQGMNPFNNNYQVHSFFYRIVFNQYTSFLEMMLVFFSFNIFKKYLRHSFEERNIILLESL